ncbi:hypothetical protein [Granulicella arctica]|uniref:Uncharacterized protein n=1 Tax=Granulicella arctica TaxID=940613 RepID=A0A7Y9TF43_9BACT|nr:hypothetical protein [Granulicella arctica]NYF78341.1 hypothetical protein [Granulicella arctica]
MKRLLSFSLAFFTCFCLLIATERQALAYVDPGSGLLALQSAASVMVAVGYFMRRRIRALFGGRQAPTVVPVPLAAEKSGTRKEA